MSQNKNIKPHQLFVLNEKEQIRDKSNYKTKETESIEKEMKDGDLNPTNKISENIHTKPAEEQQFENNG